MKIASKNGLDYVKIFKYQYKNPNLELGDISIEQYCSANIYSSAKIQSIIYPQTSLKQDTHNNIPQETWIITAKKNKNNKQKTKRCRWEDISKALVRIYEVKHSKLFGFEF